jgi:hypothetical protein
MIKASDEIFNEKHLKGFDIYCIISIIALLTDVKVFMHICQAIFNKCLFPKNVMRKRSEQRRKTRVLVTSAIFVESLNY